MSRQTLSIPGTLALAIAMLLVGIVPTSGAAAAEPWDVEIGSTGSVLAEGAGLSIPVTVTCPEEAQSQTRMLVVQVYEYSDPRYVSYYFSHFRCDGAPHTITAVMDSRKRVRTGTALVRALVDSCDGSCEVRDRDTENVSLTNAPASLDSTSTLAMGPTGTLVAKGAQVRVPVTVTCESGDHSQGGASVSLYQVHGSAVTARYGRTTGEVVCDGAPHTVELLVDAGKVRYRAGVALVMASVLLCPEGQGVSPGGSGPGCRRIDEAAEITLVR